MLQLLERLLMVLLEPRTFLLYDLICNCLGAVVLYCEKHGKKKKKSEVRFVGR